MELMKCSLDRLTIVGDLNDHLVDSLTQNPMVASQRMAKHPYKYQFNMVDGSVLQIADKATHHVAQVRFEFNPNNWDAPDTEWYEGGNLRYKMSMNSNIMTILRLIKNPRLTRVDIALDIKGVDFATKKIIDTKVRSESVIKGKDKKIETYYFGTRRSDVMIRIYNKAREQGLKHYSDDSWWRVEAQVMGESAEGVASINPFEGLAVTVPSINEEYDIRTKAMLYYLKDHPEAINDLDPKSKKKYRELILATYDHTEKQLTEFYEENKQTVLEEIKQWKALCSELAMDWEAVSTEYVTLKETDYTWTHKKTSSGKGRLVKTLTINSTKYMITRYKDKDNNFYKLPAIIHNKYYVNKTKFRG